MRVRKTVMLGFAVVLALVATFSAPPSEAVASCNCLSGPTYQTTTETASGFSCQGSKQNLAQELLGQVHCTTCSQSVVYTDECSYVLVDKPIYFSSGYIRYRCYPPGCIIP